MGGLERQGRVKQTFFDFFLTFGVDLRKLRGALRGLPAYWRDARTLRDQGAGSAGDFPLGRAYPCLDDRFAESGSARGHYFHQDIWVARRIFLNQPERHVDVGSRVDGFVAHVAAFRPITVLDIRPLASNILNVTFVQADMMRPLPAELRESFDSVSCLHALEHFGLGRYGDPVQLDGYAVGLTNLTALLRPGGKLYLSVPIGPQRIEFNAHRVFSPAFLLERLQGEFRLDQFSYVDDAGDLHADVPVRDADLQNHFGCMFGCGIFEFTRR